MQYNYLNYYFLLLNTQMDLSDKERYSISKVSEDTFVLTDADTLQTWQIEILRNCYKEQDNASLKSNSSREK